MWRFELLCGMERGVETSVEISFQVSSVQQERKAKRDFAKLSFDARIYLTRKLLPPTVPEKKTGIERPVKRWASFLFLSHHSTFWQRERKS